MDNLVVLASQVDDIPTIEQLDAMLIELNTKQKCVANAELRDSLLDLRTDLKAA